MLVCKTFEKGFQQAQEYKDIKKTMAYGTRQLTLCPACEAFDPCLHGSQYQTPDLSTLYMQSASEE